MSEKITEELNNWIDNNINELVFMQDEPDDIRKISSNIDKEYKKSINKARKLGYDSGSKDKMPCPKDRDGVVWYIGDIIEHDLDESYPFDDGCNDVGYIVEALVYQDNDWWLTCGDRCVLRFRASDCRHGKLTYSQRLRRLYLYVEAIGGDGEHLDDIKDLEESLQKF